MKQKFVIKVSMADQKSRKKVFKTAVSQNGVESAALRLNERDQIEVIGDGIDPVLLVRLLRKKVGYAELVSVGPVGEKKDGGDGKKEGTDQKKNETPPLQPPLFWSQYPYNGVPQFQVCEIRDPNYDPSCTIM